MSARKSIAYTDTGFITCHAFEDMEERRTTDGLPEVCFEFENAARHQCSVGHVEFRLPFRAALQFATELAQELDRMEASHTEYNAPTLERIAEEASDVLAYSHKSAVHWLEYLKRCQMYPDPPNGGMFGHYMCETIARGSMAKFNELLAKLTEG